MLFNISDFIMKTLKGMIGNYPDFQVREYALNWYEKGKITEENLSEIETLVEAQYIETVSTEDETEYVEEPIEEVETGILEGDEL